MAAKRAVTCAVLALVLSGCTTLSAGFASRPPGINVHSFRECLLSNGFFTDTALLGRSRELAEARWRAAAAKSAPRQLRDIAGISDPAFVALTARTIRNGLFPRLQLGEGIAWTEQEGGNGARAVAEESYNGPYAIVSEGGAYDAAASPLAAPRPGPPLQRPDIAVNRYLDCYIAPVGTDVLGSGSAAAEGGDYDMEGRLLRAHLLLTMIASYGAELVSTGSGKRAPEHAARLLGHVRDAEMSLRMASVVANDSMLQAAVQQRWAEQSSPMLRVAQDRAGVSPARRWDGYATRLLRTFQVAVDIEVIDAHQSFDRASNVIAALSTMTGASAVGVLQDAIKGLATVQKVQIYGDAMRRDAAETLAAHRLQILRGPPLAGASASWMFDRNAALNRWGDRDTPLDRECRLLAALAKQADAGCTPDAATLKKATAAEAPLVPPGATAAPAGGAA